MYFCAADCIQGGQIDGVISEGNTLVKLQVAAEIDNVPFRAFRAQILI